jgi:hypothetical protein
MQCRVTSDVTDTISNVTDTPWIRYPIGYRLVMFLH